MFARIHRYHDKIGIYIGIHIITGEIAYFTPEQATQVAKALLKHSQDIKNVTFLGSTLETFDLSKN